MRSLTTLARNAGKLALPTMFAAIVLIGTVTSANSQGTDANLATSAAPAKPVIAPAVRDLNGITLGMTASEVKKKLGSPTASDETSMFFDLSNMNVQLRLKDGKTEMVAVTYSGKDTAQMPDPVKVFGPGVEIEPEENGKIYKLVRYPDAGYWVAYSKLILKDKTMTTVTIHSLK